MRSGDACPVCLEGQLRVTSTTSDGGRRTQYLGCKLCSATAKDVFRIDEFNRRMPSEAEREIDALNRRIGRIEDLLTQLLEKTDLPSPGKS